MDGRRDELSRYRPLPPTLPFFLHAAKSTHAMAEAEARAMAEAEAEARAMAEAEAEARAMAEAEVEARARARPPPSEETVSRLLSAIAVLTAPPSGAAVAEANAWLMRLAETAECWSCALAALPRAPSEAAAHALLSLCLSLVRQAQMGGAPLPSELAPFVRQLWCGATEATPVRRQACTLLCALACNDGQECDRLLNWAFGLAASDGSLHLLALHVMQDVAHEAFHRPLQSKPLNALLQEVAPDAIEYLDDCATSDALLLLALQVGA